MDIGQRHLVGWNKTMDHLIFMTRREPWKQHTCYTSSLAILYVCYTELLSCFNFSHIGGYTIVFILDCKVVHVVSSYVSYLLVFCLYLALSAYIFMHNSLDILRMLISQVFQQPYLEVVFEYQKTKYCSSSTWSLLLLVVWLKATVHTSSLH